MTALFDSVAMMLRIKLAAQVDTEVALLGAASPLERIKIASRLADLLQQLTGEGLPAADPLQVELDAAKAELEQHNRLINLGALTPAGIAALDRYSAAKTAIERRDREAELAKALERDIGSAVNKPRIISAADALTPAGAIKADAKNSKADSAIWYYQGDIKTLGFTASVRVGGQLSAGADRAKATLVGLKAARSQGFRLVSMRAGSLGTVWVLESPDGKGFMTRGGFEDASNPVFARPPMPEDAPGYESMLAGQTALAKAFVTWLDTLPYEQRHNQGVVTRKINSTAIADWLRINTDLLGIFIQYRGANGAMRTRIQGKDFDAMVALARDLATMPEIVPQQPPAPAANYPLYPSTPLFHGTALPFTSYAGGTRKGSGYDHQGKGFYLTSDKRGYAHFFALQAADKILNGPNEPEGEEARILKGGGVILDVSLASDARIIDLTRPQASPELLAMVKNITEGADLRERVLAEGYDGVAFIEPNAPEGVQVEGGAVTVVVYNTDKASIAGFEEAANVQALDLGETAVPEPTPELAIIEHTTGKGKVLRGIVRTDLTYAEAKAIDEYTFKKDGGWFIREKHLQGFAGNIDTKLKDLAARRDPEDPEAEMRRLEAAAQAQADRLANEQLRQQEKITKQVAKLREVAASTLERADAEVGRDRLANTARRARMAASGREAAEATRAIALTMNNLADAIERGQAQHLSGITSRADVETLVQRLVGARSEYEKANNISYSERERRKHDPITADEARYATFPDPKWDTAGANRARVLELIKGKKGAPALAQRIRYAPYMKAEDVQELRAMIGQKEADSQLGWWNIEQLAKAARLRRAGITNTLELRDALAEFVEFKQGARPEDPIAKAERAIIGQKVGIDFFPTPSGEATTMARLAQIKPGDDVLEPSAGNGNLADAAKAAGANVDVIELSPQLQDILQAKGYNLVATDFETFTPSKQYDAIVMNPPFSNRKDAAHIMRAFTMLKPGGRLVAIAGEGVFFGSDKAAVAFREWLEANGAEVEGLAAKTFMDTKLLATTGANARRIVVIR